MLHLKDIYKQREMFRSSFAIYYSQPTYKHVYFIDKNNLNVFRIFF